MPQLERIAVLCLGILACLSAGIPRPAGSAPEGVRIWEEGGESHEVEVVPLEPERVKGLKV